MGSSGTLLEVANDLGERPGDITSADTWTGVTRCSPAA
jgi:hypothetical protein